MLYRDHITDIDLRQWETKSDYPCEKPFVIATLRSRCARTHSSIPEYNRELASNGIITRVISGVINEVITEQRGCGNELEDALWYCADDAEDTRGDPVVRGCGERRKPSSERKRRYILSIYIYIYRQPDSQDELMNQRIQDEARRDETRRDVKLGNFMKDALGANKTANCS